MMGVLTRPIWKTSTCLMQPSAALTMSLLSTRSASRSAGSGSSPIVWSWSWHGMAWHGVAWRRAGRVVPPLRVAGRASRVRVRRLAHEPLR